MKLLCIDTSGSHDSLALVSNLECVGKHSAEHSKREHPKLLHHIELLMLEAGWSWTQLDGIAIGLGPGGFTRLRTGFSVGKILAYGLNRPLFGVSTLKLICSQNPSERTLVITDAGREEVYFENLNGQITCGTIERIGHVFQSAPPALVCGSGALRYSKALEQWFPDAMIVKEEWLNQPQAHMLARLIDAQSPLDLRTAQPNYVRPSDAELTYPDGFPDATIQFQF